MTRLGLYFGDLGENTDLAFVPTRRAKTERGARRVLRKWLVQEGYGGYPPEPDYAYAGIVSEAMHDHGPDESCPGHDCLGDECTVVDDVTYHGPGCPGTATCPTRQPCHKFDAQ